MQLREVLSFGGLKTATVAAGIDGLDLTIESVSVLEIAEESISSWTLNNQLYITSFYAICDDIEMQKTVIRTLSRCGCCGLVICHIEYVLHQIDPSIINLCNDLHFPLIIANTDTSFIEIINPIYSRLSNPDPSTKETLIRSDFIDLLTSERSTSEILKALAFKVGYAISFLDIHFNFLYSNKDEIQKERESLYLKEATGWKSMDIPHLHYCIMESPGNAMPTMIYYIKKGGNLFGFICIEFQPGDTVEHVLAIADTINLPCALLINKIQKISRVEADYQQTFFSDLLVWNFRSNETALARAKELGYSLLEIHHVIVVNLNALQAASEKERELVNYIQRWFLPNVEQIVQSYSHENILHFRSDIFLILISNQTSEEQMYQIADRIVQLFANSKVTSVSVGISMPMKKFTEIPRAYNEAFDIAILGRTLLGMNQVANFEKLGMLHHLKAMRNSSHIVYLCQQIVHPLQVYDESKNSELVKTAHVLFACNLDVQQSAEKLHIHRNTLLYRKKLIQDIMGYDAFSLPYSYNFMAALFVIDLQ